jgi:hypothetical protein
MTATQQALIDKIRQLSPDHVAEIDAFVDFLRFREDEARLTRVVAKASEPGFARVWENDDDAAYDQM